MYSKTCVKRPLTKRPKIGFQDQLSPYAGQKYCRMLQGEHSAILSTFIKLTNVIKIFFLSIFEWPLKTGFTVFNVGSEWPLEIFCVWLKITVSEIHGTDEAIIHYANHS